MTDFDVNFLANIVIAFNELCRKLLRFAWNVYQLFLVFFKNKKFLHELFFSIGYKDIINFNFFIKFWADSPLYLELDSV